jgi:hypothetical protein
VLPFMRLAICETSRRPIWRLMFIEIQDWMRAK